MLFPLRALPLKWPSPLWLHASDAVIACVLQCILDVVWLVAIFMCATMELCDARPSLSCFLQYIVAFTFWRASLACILQRLGQVLSYCSIVAAEYWLTGSPAPSNWIFSYEAANCSDSGGLYLYVFYNIFRGSSHIAP